MKLLRIKLLFVILSMSLISYGQIDTTQKSQRTRRYSPSIDKSLCILLGVHLQSYYDPSGGEHDRIYLELGLHKSIVSDYGVLTHGLSAEISPQTKPVIGLKYGGWANFYFFSLGLSAIYYTNIKHSNLMIRPEFGLGIRRFKLGVGFNRSIISNKNFDELYDPEVQIILNVLLKNKLFGGKH